MTKASDNDFPSLLVTEQGSAPASPAASHQRLYIRTSDHTLVTVNSSGTVASVGGGGTAGALVFLQAQTASASAQLDFTTFISSTYDTYKIEVVNIRPATDTADLLMEVGTGVGPTYDTGNTYEWTAFKKSTAGAAVDDYASTGVCRLFTSMSNNSAYGYGVASLTLTDPQSTTQRKAIQGTHGYVNSSPAAVHGPFWMQWTTSGTAMTALRFIASSGNITSGVIRIYGVAKS